MSSLESMNDAVQAATGCRAEARAGFPWTTSRMSKNNNPNARSKARRHTLCEIRECNGLVNGLSRYCTRHKQRDMRFGSPDGRAIRLQELKPFERSIDAFLNLNRDHPALCQASARLGELLQSYSSNSYPRALHPLDWQSRLHLELRRLHSGGVTGDEMLRAVALVWLFAHYRERTVPKGRPLAFAMARAVINLRTRYQHAAPLESTASTGRITNGTSALVLQHLGEELITLLALVLIKMTEAIEQGAEERKEYRTQILQALDQQPFT